MRSVMLFIGLPFDRYGCPCGDNAKAIIFAQQMHYEEEPACRVHPDGSVPALIVYVGLCELNQWVEEDFAGYLE